MITTTLEQLFDVETLEQIALGSPKIADIDWSDERIDQIGETLNDLIENSALDLTPQDYWEDLRSELIVFVCTDDERYRDIKKRIANHGHKSQTAIISTISVFIGSELGIEAGILTPYCALLLAMALKIGKEAFCRGVAD